MTKSMTAFARRENNDEIGHYCWELRSVNHRYLELSPRLPEEFRSLEPKIRERISAKLKRGKIDCNLRFNLVQGVHNTLCLNQNLVDQLVGLMDTIGKKLSSQSHADPGRLLSWPGVVESNALDLASLHNCALQLLDLAIDDLLEMRGREGAALETLITDRLKGIDQQTHLARQYLPEIRAALREKFTSRFAELKESLDPTRIEQEVLVLSQKLDIDEELDRLDTHVQEIKRVLKLKSPIGRRLDFLMQELNREANTLGSKSVDSRTSAISVELKVLIEQIREQVQNIE